MQRHALITGSGLADFGAAGPAVPVTTRFGMPSAAPRRVEIAGQDVLVLPRHGDRHSIPPHRVNYRANVAALRQLGAEAIISVNSVGVIPTKPAAGSLAVPAQIVDYTWGREHSFCDGYGDDVHHLDFTEPFTAGLRVALLEAADAAAVACHDGGVYGATQGPRLESAAEIDRLDRDGVIFVGMTAMPEVALVRELGLSSACLSMVVNRAAGRGNTDIHADIDRSMAQARAALLCLLECYFCGDPV